MSKDSIPVTQIEQKDTLNWNEISDAFERMAGLHDTLKRLGIPLPSVARAATLANMNLHLIEAGGDPFKAMIAITDFMYRMWFSVCKNMQTSLGEAIKTKKLQGQKLTETELEAMQALVANMEMIISTHHTLSADELSELLSVQEILAEHVMEQNKHYSQLAVARSLIVMAQQFMFFDMSGDLLSAKAAFADQQHLLWDVAVTNAISLTKEHVDQQKGAPAEDKPN